MFEKPGPKHAWLDQLVGQWIVESECPSGPDGAVEKNTGRMRCRSLGGLWLIAEGEGQTPDGSPALSIMTIGYDPKQNAYVGTFVASMMTHLWPYRGTVDASGKRLALDSTGPSFTGEGTAQYRDTIEIVDADNWNFFGEVLAEDGTWQQIMFSRNRRG